MTNTLDMQKSGKFRLDNKIIGLGIAVYSVIEAIFAYLFFFKPLYIDPVYLKCDEYNASGVTCLVKLFGKMLATPEEVENNQVILSLWDSVLNIILIYLVITGVALALAFCMYKGMSFAKTYFVVLFGAKHVLGMFALIVPVINMRRGTMIFGIIDALFSIALCVFFVTLTNEEYIDDMLLNDEQISAMNKRMKFGFILYAGFALFCVFEKYAMYALGKSGTLFLNWKPEVTALTPAFKQGFVVIALLAVALVAAIVYIKETDWAMHFFAAFGFAAAISNIIALINRLMWVPNVYNRLKGIFEAGDENVPEWKAAETLMKSSNGVTSSWIFSVVCLVLAIVASAAVAAFATVAILKKTKFKFSAADAKPAVALIISAGSVLLCFILTIAARVILINIVTPDAAYHAMDYLYFIAFGGVSLFLALAMWSGYSFTKFGALALFIVTAASNFSAIFEVLQSRKDFIALKAAEGVVESGNAFYIVVVLLVLSIVSCFGIITSFVVKGVDDYMYEKRFS
ncbi:MAG: hypothetical protein E7478_00255 [Ruminococcaceae bacterium]|nr:hypothetical protein [Oscillospiraceae bacterium]